MTLRATILLVLCLPCVLLISCGHRSDENGSQGNLNRLANAQSPYLKEHADNPVDWYEWGDEALEKAKRENKPLIISIGYASCHWCHVMEKESFMDTAVARLMNENFVSIKIDREERPDIDQIYLEAAQLISGNSGWPLNAFALPDGKPFYAATYFPKEHWMSMLQKVIEAYQKENNNVVKQADALTKSIQENESIVATSNDVGKFTQADYQTIFSTWESSFDYKSGGLQGSPKFPMPVVWEYALQNHYLTKNEKSLEIVTTTLNEMAKGGIYDPLGGGFARYATDENWIVPHFEKMLYDNGQLVSLYAHAYQVTHSVLYADVVNKTLAFINREMTSPEGGFYASLNADSEGEEGKFYVWTKVEIEKALDRQTAEWITQYYQISDSGNWEHEKNILYAKTEKEEFAKKNDIDPETFKKIMNDAEEKLLHARSQRVRPSLDDKILVSWNALMLKGYLDAYFALGNPEYLNIALANAHFLEKNMMRKGGQLWRNFHKGKASTNAFLEDYALLAKAFIHLYQATFDIHWLEQAESLTAYAIKHFRDEQSGLFYYTSDAANELIVRKIEIADNVIPSSNAVLAEVIYLLGEYFIRDSYLQMSTSMLQHVVQKFTTAGPYYCYWSSLLGLVTYKPYEIAIVGKEAREKSMAIQQHYLPTSLFMGGENENLPLLENKSVDQRTMIYVCRNKTCKAPEEDVGRALTQLTMNK
jgi:uncharacterized protein YyaL (SSP411 family)